MLISTELIFYVLGLCLPVVLSGHLYVQPSDDYRAFFTGEDFFISCVLDSEAPDGGRLSWRAPTGEITDNDGRVHVETEDRNGERVLHLFVQGVRLEDKGDYVCVVDNENDDERDSHIVNVEVYRAISFTGTPEEQVASEGDASATILCNVIGDPEPGVSWIFNRRSLRTGGRYKVSKGELTIANITRYDVGDYYCQAVVVTEKKSMIKKQKIKFRVQFAPFFTETESELNSDLEADTMASRSVFAPMRSVARLICRAEGYPSPTYQWLKNGRGIDEITYDSLVSVYNVTHYEDRSVMNISLFDDELLGPYVCRVSNEMGSAEKILTLKEGDPPARPSVVLKHSDNNSAYFSLSFGKHGSGRKKNHRKNPLRVTSYLLQFRTSVGTVNGLTPVDWDTADQIEFKEGDDLIVKNLTSDTGYVVRVAAKNLAGYGQFSPEIRFNMHSKGENSNVPVVVSDQGASPNDNGGINRGLASGTPSHILILVALLAAPLLSISQLMTPINHYCYPSLTRGVNRCTR